MRSFRIVFAAALVNFVPGCVIGVAWMPDSSGFVFTTPKGHLIAYDYKTKKQEVVLIDRAAATTAWPAFTADGKKIALAHLALGDKKDAEVQIVVCNLKGLVESRTAKLKFAAIKGKDLQFSTQVVWSPDAKKLLIHGQANANEGEGFDAVGLFDFGTEKLQIWDNHVLAYFGSTPIRPDGAGFLMATAKPTDEVGEYTWVDWSGKTQKLARARRRPAEDEAQSWTALFDSHWQGTKAIVTLPKHRFMFDTKTLTEKIEPTLPAETTLGREVIRMRATLASGVELLLLVHDGGERVVARKKGEPGVTEVIAPVRDRVVLLSAAPDRSRAVVRIGYGYRGAKGDTIHVIDGNGKLHDTIDVHGEYVKR